MHGTWLPNTLTPVQLKPHIAKLCPAKVTYSPSNHSPQYKCLGLFICLLLSKFIQKLDVALSWEQLNFQFFLSLKPNGKEYRLLKLGIFFFIVIRYKQVHFLTIRPSSSTWKKTFIVLDITFPLVLEVRKCSNFGSSLALTILSEENQERWDHSRGSYATESKVLAWDWIDWRDYRLSRQLWQSSTPFQPIFVFFFLVLSSKQLN